MHETDVTETQPRGILFSRWMIVAAVVSVTVLIGSLIPSPYAVEGPGPTLDVMGTVLDEDGEVLPVISIDGATTYPDEGTLRLLTVSVSGSPQHPRSWFSLIPAVLNPKQQIRPLEDFFPEGISEDERTERNSALMMSSQEVAAAAAFLELGEEIPIELTVADISEGGPATGVLEVGDTILRVGGEAIERFDELRERIVAGGADAPLTLTVGRDGEEVDLELTPAVPEGGTEPLIGAVIQSTLELPRDVQFAVEDIGGPSAGLVFALGIMDRMTKESMLEGLNVAGTGTISIDGRVGPIGGLEQKLLGAQSAGSELFLMPLANCADLPERIPSGLQVATVETLDEAVSAIEAAAAGERPAGIERCSA